MMPVYFINGFLESGKTSFLKFTLAQDYFRIKGTTLLILCEDGEEEFDDKLIKKSKTIIERIEDEEQFTPAYLMELEKKWRPERIIVEYNGMWNMKDLELPFHWNLEQQITCVDASTFSSYFTNMRSLVAEMVRKSELIIFNRCDNVMDDLGMYRRNIKAVNAAADVVFENSQGEINEIFEEDLPYDLKADEIVLDDKSYGIWYLDMVDHLERYIGKKISFVGMVMKAPNFPKDCFVPGRLAMTCCADDIAFLGFICKYKGAANLANKEYVKISVEVKKEFWADYKGEGPVLYALDVAMTSKPAEEVISFS